MRHLTIKSDGTTVGTKILCDGEEVTNVTEVTLRWDANKTFCEATFRVTDVAVDLDGQACLSFTGPGSKGKNSGE